MSDHTCPHEQDFGVLLTNLKKIDKDLYGNGQKGIVPRFIIMETEHVTVLDNLEKLATSYSALYKSQLTMDTTEKIKAENRRMKAENKKMAWSVLEKVATVFGVGLSLVGLVYVILDYVRQVG